MLDVATDVEVTRLLGVDTDHGCLQVRLHHEQVVLEPTPAFGEADVILDQEGSTEQLVHGERVHQRSVSEGGDRAGPGEQHPRHRPANAPHLSEHDVGPFSTANL